MKPCEGNDGTTVSVTIPDNHRFKQIYCSTFTRRDSG